MRNRVRAAPADRFEVVLTGVALAVLLRREGFAGARALVLGTPAFRAEVLAAGLADGDGADPRSIDLVVVGGSADLGSRELTTATRALRAGARLFGSNRDPVFPTPSRAAPPSRTWPSRPSSPTWSAPTSQPSPGSPDAGAQGTSVVASGSSS